MEIDDTDVKSGVPMQGFQAQQVITYRRNPAGPDGRFSSSYFSSRFDLFFASSPPSVSDAVFVTPWTVVRQAPLSTEFCRQEYWNGLPSPPQSSWPGIEHASPTLAGRFLTSAPPGKSPSTPSSPPFLKLLAMHVGADGVTMYYIFKILFIEVQLIYDDVFISAVWQSISVTHTHNTHTNIPFHILFHDGLSQNAEYNPPYYTIGPCCLLF